MSTENYIFTYSISREARETMNKCSKVSGVKFPFTETNIYQINFKKQKSVFETIERVEQWLSKPLDDTVWNSVKNEGLYRPKYRGELLGNNVSLTRFDFENDGLHSVLCLQYEEEKVKLCEESSQLVVRDISQFPLQQALQILVEETRNLKERQARMDENFLKLCGIVLQNVSIPKVTPIFPRRKTDIRKQVSFSKDVKNPNVSVFTQQKELLYLFLFFIVPFLLCFGLFLFSSPYQKELELIYPQTYSLKTALENYGRKILEKLTG